jgi:hypothetical protein
MKPEELEQAKREFAEKEYERINSTGISGIKVKTLSELFANYEKTADPPQDELAEIKVTMAANFGGNYSHLPKLLDGNEKTALQMFLKIMNYYYSRDNVDNDALLAQHREMVLEEMPSDEEIKKNSTEHFGDKGEFVLMFRTGFIVGQKELRKQLTGK